MLFRERQLMSKLILLTQEEKDLWKSVVAVIASSANVTEKSAMYYWADKAVEYYRERINHE